VSGPGGTTGSSGASGGASGLGSDAATGTGTTTALSITLPSRFAPVASYTSLVKDYEFNGSSLPVDWSAGIWNYGYQATQYQPSQVTLTGSAAALTAIRQTSPQGYPYESGWISTDGAYTVDHGLIDFRAKMPAGQGLWSGLWLVNPQGSNPEGEIDVQEMLLADTHTVYGSAHGWAPAPIWSETQSVTEAADLSQDFHDYQLIWQPGMLTWAVDGVAYAQYTKAEAEAHGYPWPFDTQTGTYLIANLAVAAAGEWGGAPLGVSPFPATMEVQSIRVWQ